jgi:hypothetical protein
MARAPAGDYEAPRADVARLNYSKAGAAQMQASSLGATWATCSILTRLN